MPTRQLCRGIGVRLPRQYALHHLHLHQQADCQASHAGGCRPGACQRTAPKVYPCPACMVQHTYTQCVTLLVAVQACLLDHVQLSQKFCVCLVTAAACYLCRSSQHVLSVKTSSSVAVGHAQLPLAILQSVKLRQHGRLRLQSITLATQMKPSSITLHPMPHSPASSAAMTSTTAQQAKVTEELSEPDLKQLLATWLAAQASILGSGDPREHVPVQQCTVVHMTPGTDATTEQQQHLAFMLYMKQPPSLRADPLASYALLSAADLTPSSKLSVSQGGPALAVQEWVLPHPPSEQVLEQQAAMLSSSEALRTAASSALKHLLPLLAFSVRYQPADCQLGLLCSAASSVAQ